VLFEDMSARGRGGIFLEVYYPHLVWNMVFDLIFFIPERAPLRAGFSAKMFCEILLEQKCES